MVLNKAIFKRVLLSTNIINNKFTNLKRKVICIGLMNPNEVYRLEENALRPIIFYLFCFCK